MRKSFRTPEQPDIVLPTKEDRLLLKFALRSRYEDSLRGHRDDGEGYFLRQQLTDAEFDPNEPVILVRKREKSVAINALKSVVEQDAYNAGRALHILQLSALRTKELEADKDRVDISTLDAFLTEQIGAEVLKASNAQLIQQPEVVQLLHEPAEDMQLLAA